MRGCVTSALAQAALGPREPTSGPAEQTRAPGAEGQLRARSPSAASSEARDRTRSARQPHRSASSECHAVAPVPPRAGSWLTTEADFRDGNASQVCQMPKCLGFPCFWVW